MNNEVVLEEKGTLHLYSWFSVVIWCHFDFAHMPY